MSNIYQIKSISKSISTIKTFSISSCTIKEKYRAPSSVHAPVITQLMHKTEQCEREVGSFSQKCSAKNLEMTLLFQIHFRMLCLVVSQFELWMAPVVGLPNNYTIVRTTISKIILEIQLLLLVGKLARPILYGNVKREYLRTVMIQKDCKPKQVIMMHSEILQIKTILKLNIVVKMHL